MKKFTWILGVCIIAILAFSACLGKKATDEVEKPPVESVVTDDTNKVTEEINKAEEKVEEKVEDIKKEETKKPETKPSTDKQEETTKPEEKPAEKPVEKPEEKPEEKPADTRKLSDIMASLYEGVGETPVLMSEDLTEENFSFFAFADYVNGATAHVSEPMMGSYAHSVVLVRLPEGADVAAFADEVKAKANPRKWICVEAEKVTVTTKGNLVLLVMSSEEYADIITANFKAKA